MLYIIEKLGDIIKGFVFGEIMETRTNVINPVAQNVCTILVYSAVQLLVAFIISVCGETNTDDE